MAWVSILSVQVDANSPLDSVLFGAIKSDLDWLYARVQDTPTDANWITFDHIGSWFSTAGAVGTYMFAKGSTSDVAFGSTLAGSSLTPTSGVYKIDTGMDVVQETSTFNTGAAQSGTWRCMGTYDYTTTSGSGDLDIYGATLWMRIA